MNDLTILYCSVDDFCKLFEKQCKQHLIGDQKSKTGPLQELSTSEMRTIIILFHQSNYRTFKHFYAFVYQHLRREFSKVINYSRFVYLKKMLFVPLFAYLLYRKGEMTGIDL